jgi:hypothetical protein
MAPKGALFGLGLPGASTIVLGDLPLDCQDCPVVDSRSLPNPIHDHPTRLFGESATLACAETG